jgi:hypothetical protein
VRCQHIALVQHPLQRQTDSQQQTRHAQGGPHAGAAPQRLALGAAQKLRRVGKVVAGGFKPDVVCVVGVIDGCRAVQRDLGLGYGA